VNGDVALIASHDQNGGRGWWGGLWGEVGGLVLENFLFLFMIE